MDMQNVSSLQIPEGDVRTIHDKDNRLLWGKTSYSVKYTGDTYQQTYSGKNLYQSIGITTASNGLISTLQQDGTLKITGTASANSSNFTGIMTTSLPAGTYTLSMTKTMPFRILLRASNNQNIGVIESGNTSVTFTTTTTLTSLWIWGYLLTSGTTYNETVGFMLEAGSSATSFEPYTAGPSPNPDYPQEVQTVTGEQTVTVTGDGGISQSRIIDIGSTELCKIGDYQDYIYKIGGGWYVHKEVGHITRAIEDMTGGNYPGWEDVQEIRDTIGVNINAALNTVTSYRTNIASANTGFNINTNSTNARLFLPRGTWGDDHTETYWKTNYPNLIVELYYGIRNGQADTQITDATLIGQLNDVHGWLTRYGYNATVTGDLPIVIDKTNL